MRGRRPWVVLAATALAVAGAVLPAAAQEDATTTTTEAPVETSTTTRFTLLPTTTSTTEDPPEEIATTTTTVRRTATTLTPTTQASRPVATFPPTTTTTMLPERTEVPALGATTSLPPPADFDEGVSPGTIVLLVISGLVLAALGLVAFTVRYWRSTDPAARAAAGGTVPKHG